MGEKKKKSRKEECVLFLVLNLYGGLYQLDCYTNVVYISCIFSISPYVSKVIYAY